MLKSKADRINLQGEIMDSIAETRIMNEEAIIYKIDFGMRRKLFPVRCSPYLHLDVFNLDFL